MPTTSPPPSLSPMPPPSPFLHNLILPFVRLQPSELSLERNKREEEDAEQEELIRKLCFIFTSTVFYTTSSDELTLSN
jgi:hypothetical protein